MKRKPQISWTANLSASGVKNWVIKYPKKAPRIISQKIARKYWDGTIADWSIPAYQQMAHIVMTESQTGYIQ